MKLRYYISGHGLGHASRSCQIINAIGRLFPDIALEIVSDAAPWFFATALNHPWPLRRTQLDVGAVQRDSLVIDLPNTLSAWRRLERVRQKLLAAEVASLRDSRIDLVVSDVVPLACAAAAEAKVPAVVIGNFTWDWILEGFSEREGAFAPLAAQLRRDYEYADLLLRLPFCGEMPQVPRTEDLPLVARRSHTNRNKTRSQLGIAPAQRIGLISFGGFGLLDFDFSSLGGIKGWTFLTEKGLEGDCANLVSLPPGSCPYPDLVAAADVVITKPGYGIVSECIANGTAVLYTSRGDFREQPLLVDGLRRFARSREIDPERLRNGRWQSDLDALLKQPPPADHLACDGDRVAAERLIRYLAVGR